jgi:peptidoglycan-associated lipoprotein
MKVMTKVSLASLFSVMLVLGGCGGDEAVKEPEAPPRAIVPPPPPPPEPPAVEEPAPEPVVEQEQVNPLLNERVVYFDFDSSVITDEALPIIKAHAEYLSAHGDIAFTLEGHCDERGTREYNIALGERRADAVRRMLVANGVAEGQIKVVSYGEERPAQLGHNESAWAANRRAVFNY